MNFISITSWNDLPAVAGITALTGEACAFSQRLLCDVNEDGLELLQDYFGVPELKLAEPYNFQVQGKPSVGSLMLARRSLEPLGEFILAKKGALAILYLDNRLHGGLMSEDYVTKYAELSERHSASQYSIQRIYRPGTAACGSRNVHAATGRVV